MATQKAFPIGVVSEGTLLAEDLIPAFLDALSRVAPARAASLEAQWHDLCDGAEDSEEDYPDLDGEECAYLLEEIEDALNDAAPDYVYFGADDGDGACFGYWVDMERVEEDARSGELLKLDDSSKVPTGHAGLVLVVNDHGNATLFRCDADGAMEEIWSVV